MTSLERIRHPLPVGTRVQAVKGLNVGLAWDQDSRSAKPGTVGTITTVSRQSNSGWTYGLLFDTDEAWTVVSDYELNDPAQYVVLC